MRLSCGNTLKSPRGACAFGIGHGTYPAVPLQFLDQRAEERDHLAVVKLCSLGKNLMPGGASTNAIIRGLAPHVGPAATVREGSLRATRRPMVTVAAGALRTAWRLTPRFRRAHVRTARSCAGRPGRAGASPPSGSPRRRSATRRACAGPGRQSA